MNVEGYIISEYYRLIHKTKCKIIMTKSLEFQILQPIFYKRNIRTGLHVRMHIHVTGIMYLCLYSKVPVVISTDQHN
jgi:hypothetical protein